MPDTKPCGAERQHEIIDPENRLVAREVGAAVERLLLEQHKLEDGNPRHPLSAGHQNSRNSLSTVGLVGVWQALWQHLGRDASFTCDRWVSAIPEIGGCLPSLRSVGVCHQWCARDQ